MSPSKPRVELLEGRRLLSAEMLADIGTAAAGSYPADFVRVGDKTFFRATAGATGEELYVTDGTTAGTRLVKDIAPGSAHSSPRDLTASGGVLFFEANDRVRGAGLWRSDGTEAGTVMLAQIGSVDTADSVERMVAANGTVFFSGYAGVDFNPQLWKSDGTEAGTGVVADVRVAETEVAGGRFYFRRHDAPGLWVSDGTAAGTRRVEGSPPQPFALTPVGDTLYFAGDGDPVVREDGYVSYPPVLWKADGTGAGTARVANSPLIPANVYGSTSDYVAPLGGEVLFVGEDPMHGIALWKTDGTGAGATLVHDPFGGTGGRLYGLTEAGGKVFFAAGASPGAGADSLYVTDGTAAGTRKVKDLPGSVMYPTEVGDDFYFYSGGGIWRSDGTGGGTSFVISNNGTQFGMFGSTVLFQRDGPNVHQWGPTGQELWRSDGTAAGTYLLKDVDPSNHGSSPPRGDPVTVNGRLVFSQGGLWSTDGTRAGTRKLAGGIDGRPVSLGAYAVAVGANGVWRTDGTPAGTSRVADVVASYRETAVMNGVVYFVGDTPANPKGQELFRTDGTAAGTWRVKDIGSGSGFAQPPESLAVSDGTLFFWATGGLWKSDGTEAGTVFVKAFGPTEPGYRPFDLADVNGTLYFRSTRPGESRAPQIWKSDGTEAGTVLLREFDLPSLQLPGELPLYAWGDTAYFTQGDRAHGWELWKSDGTTAGTVLVKDLLPGRPDSLPGEFTAFNGALYFTTAGQGLWKTDGTGAGTVSVSESIVRSAAPGGRLVVANGRLYLAGRDAEHGTELWQSDGSSAGTFFHDMLPGALDSNPRIVASIGDKLVLWAADVEHGLEPWAFTFEDDGPAAVRARGVIYNGSAVAVAGVGGANPAGAVAADKRALLPGETPGFANVTSYGRGVTRVAVDVMDLPDGAGPAADDFTFRVGAGGNRAAWATAPAPSGVSVARYAGADGTDRVTLSWPDGAIRNTWLQVTVKANARTGLASPDVFYLGNLVGETGDAASPLRVTAVDLARTRASMFSKSGAASRYDHNRDGRVTAADYALARSGLANALRAPSSPVAASMSAAAPARSQTAPAPRRVWQEPESVLF